jgi:hypothetical protein
MMKASGMIVNGDKTEHHNYMRDYTQLFASRRVNGIYTYSMHRACRRDVSSVVTQLRRIRSEICSAPLWIHMCTSFLYRKHD